MVLNFNRNKLLIKIIKFYQNKKKEMLPDLYELNDWIKSGGKQLWDG